MPDPRLPHDTHATSDDARAIPSDDGGDGRTPRWVLAFGAVAVVLVLAFVALHLAGGGFRGHG